MPKFSQLIVGGLIALTIFILFNCAGFILISFWGSNTPFEQLFANNTTVGANLSQPTSADIVAYSTQAASTPTAPVLTTPLPLLPTVTPGPTPRQTVAPPATDTPLPPASPTPAQLSPPERATAQAGASTQLEILSHQSYVDSLGWYHIVGEVQNNSNVPMEFVEVVAKLYDAADNVIGTKITFTAPDVIFPGGKAPFDLITLRRAQWDLIKEYRLQVKGNISESLLQENLVLLNQSSRIEADYLYVHGQVHNMGQNPTLVKLIITVYDANFKVVNTNWGYANAGIVAPNQTSAFEVKIKHQTDPNNFHYRIQVEENAVDTR